MPSSPLRTQLRIRRNARKIGRIFLRADEGIGPYKGGALIRQIPNLSVSRGSTKTRASGRGEDSMLLFYIIGSLSSTAGGKASILRHYPAYKSKQLNVSELARVCDISRTTVYKYIGFWKHKKRQGASWLPVLLFCTCKSIRQEMVKNSTKLAAP